MQYYVHYVDCKSITQHPLIYLSLVNRRLDEWVTRDALDLTQVQQPQKKSGPGRPAGSVANLFNSVASSLDAAGGSRASTPERDVCHNYNYMCIMYNCIIVVL